MPKPDDIGLRPCAKCGGPAEHDSQRWDGIALWPSADHNGHAVYCSVCPLPATGGVELFDSYEEAAEAWNRAALPIQPAA